MEYILMINRNDIHKKNNKTNEIENKIHEELFNVLSHGEVIKNSYLRNGVRTLLISKEVADKLIDNNEHLREEYEKNLINKKDHQCRCCKTYSNLFMEDFRGTENLSKYISCPICFELEDKDYFEVMRSNDGELALKKLELIK